MCSLIQNSIEYNQYKILKKDPEKKRTSEVNVAEDNEPIAKRLRSSYILTHNMIGKAR